MSGNRQMPLPPPHREDFDFRGPLHVDVENSGFTDDQIAELAGPAPAGTAGPEKDVKGITDWLRGIWGKGRQPPTDIADLKSDVGYLSNPDLIDLPALAKAEKVPLAGKIKASSANYNYYLMRCGVYIDPQDRENFEALKFQVSYLGRNISTESMLPGSQTKTLLAADGKATIGITGSAEFGVPDLAAAGIAAPGVAANAAAKLSAQAKFVVSFHYELKTNVVDAFGVGNPFCRWFMHKGDRLRNDVLFYPVIRTPKAVTSFRCEFRAFFKIAHPDWRNPEFFLKPPIALPVSA